MKEVEQIPNSVYEEAARHDAVVLLAGNHYGCNLDITGEKVYCSDHEVELHD